MHLDVVDLKAFYYRTQLGRVAQRAVRTQLEQFWPSVRGQTVVGFGFAAPMLRPFLADARRVISLMPGPQGVMHWPEGHPNLSVLTGETQWPLATGSADRLVVLHGLETSENAAALLEEIWRVLAPGGPAVFIVPNRSGLWSRSDKTPFGFGRPYSIGQLEAQLRSHRFQPGRRKAALFIPPSQRRTWLKLSGTAERLGQSLSRGPAGGVLLLEAKKRVYAPTSSGTPEAIRRPLRVLGGIAQPAPEPVSGRYGTRRGFVKKCRNIS